MYGPEDLLSHSSLETPKNGNWQAVQSQIRCCMVWHLIRVSTVCKYLQGGGHIDLVLIPSALALALA